MFSSETISRDIGSEFFPTQYPSQTTQQTQTTGLARYRSAPSSFLAALFESDANNGNSDESEAFFSNFLNGTRELTQKSSYDNNDTQMQFPVKQEYGVGSGPRPGENNGFFNGSCSMGMESQVDLRGRNGNCSSLMRQSSSPAGFLNGFSMMGDVGNYRVQKHSEATSLSSDLNNHMNFSSGPSPSFQFMPSIPEAVNENMATTCHENNRSKNGDTLSGRDFEASAFPHDSWNGSSFNSLKRDRDGSLKMFSNYNGFENENGETMKSPSSLVHHLSLPKASSEKAAAEKFLQFQQDAVPCQIRAKRGCATHPRSIAERVRRTKISEKMKKLQDLFPSIDKQTNTSDMLDLAVEYIKDLQKQVQTLSDTRSKCICSTKHQPSILTS